ncbi:MAG: glycosyltransferase [Omnitrophica bacterium]|nr:glycosyltransferase [Candidatus Omnitrophota bacterium]
MKRVIQVVDILLFYVLGPLIGLAGLCYIHAGRLFKKKALKNGSPINRLTFCIMDLEKEKNKNGIAEDMLLKGGISKQIAVFFDFESDADSSARITDEIISYRFSIHKKSKLFSGGLRKTGDLVNLIKNIFFLLNIARREQINCVESHEAVFLGFIGLIFSRALSVPFVLHLNTSYEMKHKGTGNVSVKFLRFRRIERWLERLACRLSEVIVADRMFYKNLKSFPKECADKYVTTGVKVEAAHYALPETRQNLKGSLRIDGGDAILYVGRLHPVKYVRDLIKMFRKVHAQNNKAFLLIAGEGVLESELKNMANGYGFREKTLFLGPKTANELADLFYTADVVVQPHGGQVLVEAALAGTPSVVYNFDWHGEFVQDGKMGFIVPFGDTDSLAARTLELLSDKERNRKMGTFSREVAVRCYSRETSIENEKAIYMKLAGREKGKR